MLICAGSAMLYVNGAVDKVNQVDFTKISFGIYAIFVGFSVHTGIRTYKACKKDQLVMSDSESHPTISTEEFYELNRSSQFGWFVADHLLTLGMIGTVLGFIFMLSTSFAGLGAVNTAVLQTALMKMSMGMSTALYTTAAGLICSLLLKLQLFNYAVYLDQMAKLCECEVPEDDEISS